MEMFEVMNSKLSQGWKITDGSCSTCNAIVLYNPEDKTFNCLKCKKPVEVHTETKRDAQHEKVQQLYEQEEFIKRESQRLLQQESTSRSSDDISKKMGAKLIQGWAMLEKACADCNVPLMRSKKGQQICFGCDKDYAAKPKPEVKKQQVLEKKQTKEMHYVRNTQNSQSIQNCISGILLQAARFYNVQLKNAIDRNDEHGVSRVLESIQKIVQISQQNKH